MLISIIVPIYNAERFLEECLESICRQTCKDLEILLIDDGSADSSPQICERFAEKDSRVRFFQKENGGPSDTRNYGIERASGDYIMFFDSDDYAEPTLCEKLLQAIESAKADFAMCGYYNVATARTTQRLLFEGSREFRDKSYREDILVPTLGLVGKGLKNSEKLDKLTSVWARLYRRDIIVNYNIRYIDLKKVPSECLLFNLNYCLHAGSAVYVNEPLYYYRRNTGVSQTKHYRENLWSRWSYWIDYMKRLLASLGDPGDLTDAYYSRLCCAVIPLGGNAMKRATRRERLDEMKSFLKHDAFREGFAVFDYSNCPVYWRLFFYSAKKCRVRVFYFLTWAMRKILDFRKK